MASDVKLRKERIIEGAKAILYIRKYELTDIKEKEEEIDLMGIKEKEDGEEETIIIRIPSKPSVGVALLRKFRDYIEKKDYDRAIILSLEKYTHYTKKEAKESNIETFSNQFPFFNLFDHKMVPKHEFATEQEIENLKEKYSIDLDQLPKIRITDPTIQMLGGSLHDIIKITRKSPTAGEFTAYRYVID